LRDDLGEGPWRYGMDAANRAGAPNPNYVKKAAGSWKPTADGTRTYAAPQEPDAPEANEDGERPRRDGQRLGETGDLPYLKSEYGNLWAACKDLPWPHGVGERWLQDIIAAMQSPADTWIADDDFAAAELLRENPPKGSEKNLPSKWLQRMEAHLPSATEAAAQSERERRMDEGRARAHRIAASNTAAERALRS
jgi:hypothetical protein